MVLCGGSSYIRKSKWPVLQEFAYWGREGVVRQINGAWVSVQPRGYHNKTKRQIELMLIHVVYS